MGCEPQGHSVNGSLHEDFLACAFHKCFGRMLLYGTSLLKALWGARWLPLPPRSLFSLVKVLFDQLYFDLLLSVLSLFPINDFSVIIFSAPLQGMPPVGVAFCDQVHPLKGAFSFHRNGTNNPFRLHSFLRGNYSLDYIPLSTFPPLLHHRSIWDR